MIIPKFGNLSNMGILDKLPYPCARALGGAREALTRSQFLRKYSGNNRHTLLNTRKQIVNERSCSNPGPTDSFYLRGLMAKRKKNKRIDYKTIRLNPNMAKGDKSLLLVVKSIIRRRNSYDRYVRLKTGELVSGVTIRRNIGVGIDIVRPKSYIRQKVCAGRKTVFFWNKPWRKFYSESMVFELQETKGRFLPARRFFLGFSRISPVLYPAGTTMI